MTFLEAWLLIFPCTISATIHNSCHGSGVLPSLLAFTVFEIASLIIWGLYWMVLYPTWFTPFRHLPTPPNRRLWTGNREVLFPAYAWVDIRRISETLPNNGLVRFYESLGREVLLVTKPNALKEVLSLKPYDFGHPKLIKITMQRLTGSKFNYLSLDGHRLFRKVLRPAFTVTHIKELTPVFWEKAREMISLIESELECNPDSVISIRDYGHRATLDNIGSAMMGHDFQTMRNPDNEVRRQFNNMIVEPSMAFNLIGLLSHYMDLRPLLRITALLKKKEMKKSSDYIRGVIESIVAERQEQLRVSKCSEMKDITTIALESGAYPKEELVDLGMLFLTAGHKSSATAFDWTIYELGRRPEMQRKLREEIRKSLGPASNAVLDPGSRSQDIPYLNAILNEIIRCYPFLPVSTKVADKNTTILNEHVPKDTVIVFAPEAFNHDKELWGPDAHLFNPDRWMQVGMANSGGAISNYAMLSFGAGPWGCIGQNFAKAQLACLIAAVVQRFEIELVNGDTAGDLRAGPFKRSIEGVFARLRLIDV